MVESTSNIFLVKGLTIPRSLKRKECHFPWSLQHFPGRTLWPRLLRTNLNTKKPDPMCCTVLYYLCCPTLAPRKSAWGMCVYLRGCACAHACTLFRDFCCNSFCCINISNKFLEDFISRRICSSLDAQALFIASGGKYPQFLLFTCVGDTGWEVPNFLYQKFI